MHFYLLGLGSNIQPEHNIPASSEKLKLLGTICDGSPLLNTAPVGDTFHGEFMNQLLILKSALTAEKLKQELQSIEVSLGREPKNPARKVKDRTIDLDILYMASSAEDCRQAAISESYYQSVQALWLQNENV